MYLKVLKWPESQTVMNNPEWFFIQTGDADHNILGDSVYAKIIDKEEIINKHKPENDIKLLRGKME